MKRVNLFVAGTQKGGTTALASFLGAHPEIFVPDRKELHFFDQDNDDAQIAEKNGELHAYFSGEKTTAKYWCDATPIYMYWQHSIARIARYNPEARLVLILRSPIERAYSHWVMEQKNGKEWLPFPLAIRLERLRKVFWKNGQHRHFSYCERGYYASQIKNILNYFPENQLKIIKNEDLRQRHFQTLNEICDFLDLSRFDWPESRTVFSNSYNDMSSGSRAYLERHFTPDIAALEALIGRDCSDWLKAAV